MDFTPVGVDIAKTVALANKMAQPIWAVLARERPYDRDYVSIQPA